jgi:hypothetical protein
VQELAIETTQLRNEVRELSRHASTGSERREPLERT